MKSAVFAVCLLATISAKSQISSTTSEVDSTNRYKVVTNKFFNNWFLGAGIGGQVYFGRYDSQESLSKRISPTFNAYLGKWFTPGLGLRFGFDASSGNGLSTLPNNFYVTDIKNKISKDGVTYYKQKIKYTHLNAAALFNLTNIFSGYKEDRFYNFIPYVGFGWMTSKKSDSREDELSVTGGLLNTFRLGNALNLTLDFKGALFNGRFDHDRPYDEVQANNKIASVSIGLVYKFKKRNWDKPCAMTSTMMTKNEVSYDETELNKLRGEANDLATENNALKQQLANADKPKIIEKIIEKPASGATPPMLVIFPINQTTLAKDDRVNIGFYAQMIQKGDPKAVYIITGYADKGTGTVKRNEELSRKRAQAVYDALVNEFGISPSQLTTDFSLGGDNMFYNDPAMSRAAIIKAK